MNKTGLGRMVREDRETLLALGFSEDELRRLRLWELAVGTPDTLAEAYVRRSKKKDTLATLRAHVRDIVQQAERDGIAIRHMWFEQRSASKAYVRREEFENATKAILRGASKTFYVWKTDRLSRRGMGAVGRLLDEFEERRARLVSVVEGLDSMRGGRIVFAILSERARDEARDIALRTKVGGDAHKAEGRWPGGVLPYGLRCPAGSGTLEPNPDEFTIARERIAEPLLAGITPANVADALNSTETPTRHGKKWRAQTIIALVHSPSWAGMIPDRKRDTDEHGNPLDRWERGGVPLLHPDGTPVVAGTGVVTHTERERILEIFRSRSRPGGPIGDRRRGKRTATSLMTGTLRCPLCNGAMGSGERAYRCAARMMQGESVCGGTATMREGADRAMGDLWVSHVSALEPDSPTLHEIARRWLSYQDTETEIRKRDLSLALDAAEARTRKLQENYYVRGAVSDDDFETLSQQLSAQQDALRAELSLISRGADLTPLMDSVLLEEAWEAATVDDRRMLLRAAVHSVTFIPARYIGDKTPIRLRLRPDWRDAS